MSESDKKQKSSLPALGRRWDKARNRWNVVLKVPEWKAGTMLMCEAPLAFAGNYLRPMTSLSAEEDDQKTPALAVVGEKARLKRFLHASIKLKWTTEQILMHEVFLYCKQHAQKQKHPPPTPLKAGVSGPAAPPPAVPPPPEEVEEAGLDNFIRYVERLFHKHSYDYLLSTNGKSEMADVLKRTSLQNETTFSRRMKGTGWYPLLGHIRQEPVTSSEVNACVWFQNSIAYLIPLTALKRDQEIVIASNTQQAAINADLSHLSIHSQPKLVDKLIDGGDYQGWQQLAASVAVYGEAPLSHLPLDSLRRLKENVLQFLRNVWMNIEHNQKFGHVLDMLRIEFLMIFIDQRIQKPSPTSATPATAPSTAPPTVPTAPPTATTAPTAPTAQTAQTAQTVPPAPTAPPAATTSPSVITNDVKTDEKTTDEEKSDAKKTDEKADENDGKWGDEMPALVDRKIPALKACPVAKKKGTEGSALAPVGEFMRANGLDKIKTRVKDVPGLDALSEDEWGLYKQLVVLANRRLMLYDILPVLQNDPAARGYQSLWYGKHLDGGTDGALEPNSLVYRWNHISNKLNKHYPSFYDKD